MQAAHLLKQKPQSSLKIPLLGAHARDLAVSEKTLMEKKNCTLRATRDHPVCTEEFPDNSEANTDLFQNETVLLLIF